MYFLPMSSPALLAGARPWAPPAAEPATGSLGSLAGVLPTL